MSKDSVINFILFTFIFFSSFNNINGQTGEDISISQCDRYDTLTTEKCFNNVLKFENYEINNLAKNNNGDFIVEFTENTENNEKSLSRRFYGLKYDGQSFFSDESSSTKQIVINIDENTYNENLHFSLDGSKNLFVYIYNNRLNQYLFSIYAYNSMVELYDVNNNNNKYYIWSFNKFFNLDLDRYYSPCSYELFELKQGLSYIIAFIPKETVNEGMKTYIFIKKFRFKSFDKNAYDELGAVTFQNFVNKKILNVFTIDDDDKNTFVVLTCKSNTRRRNSEITPPGVYLSVRRGLAYYEFTMKFYSNDESKNIVITDGYLRTYYRGEELFIKSLYLNNQLVAFIYNRNGYNTFYVELFQLKYNEPTDYISSLKYEDRMITT